MRTFFLFYVFAWLLRNPLLALVLALAVVYVADARWRGRWFDPSKLLARRRALADLRRTIDVNPHDVSARNDLGRLLVESGRHAEALPHLQQAIARMDESPETHYYLGLALIHTGEPEAGARHVEAALERNPRFLYGEPQTVLARLCLQRGDAEAARRWAREAVKLNTSSLEGWLLLGEAEQALGARESAEQAYRQAIDAYQDLPRWLRVPSRRWLVEARRALAKL